MSEETALPRITPTGKYLLVKGMNDCGDLLVAEVEEVGPETNGFFPGISIYYQKGSGLELETAEGKYHLVHMNCVRAIFN
jgi:hypothetical protein